MFVEFFDVAHLRCVILFTTSAFHFCHSRCALILTHTRTHPSTQAWVLEPQTLTWGEHRKQIRDMDFQQREAAAKAAAAQVRVTSADQEMGFDHALAPYPSALVLIRQFMFTEKLKQTKFGFE